MTALHRLGFLCLFAAGACSADEARVTVRFVPRAAFATRAPTIVVNAPGMKRTLSNEELGAVGVREPTEITTPTSGHLDIQFALVDQGTTASTGTVGVDLRPDWGWGFFISIDSVNPAHGCFGCFGAQSFPLSAAYRRVAADSVWVTWAGNSIKHPVAY